MDARQSCRLIEDRPILRPAAIVHDYDCGERPRAERPDHPHQRLARLVRRDQYRGIHLRAVTVISICAAALASFVTPTVVRAGRGSANTDMYTAFMRGNSSISVR